MKYGPHTSDVLEVVRFVSRGNLLLGKRPPIGYDVLITNDYTYAHCLRAYVPPEHEGDDQYWAWCDVISREEARHRGIAQDRIPGFCQLYERAVWELTEEFVRVLRVRLPAKYAEQPDGEDEVIGSDLGRVAHHRAVFGVEASGLFERMFDLYKSGGYPCGWDGLYPKGRFIVYYPPAEELAERMFP